MREEDLIVLRFAPNDCYTHIDELVDLLDNPQIKDNEHAKQFYSSLKVDLQSNIWYARNGRSLSFPIGKGTNLFKGYQLGIIGVYDRTNVSHLNKLINDSREATDSDF